MNEWPEGWFKDGADAGNSSGMPGAANASGGGDAAVQVAGGAYRGGGGGWPGGSGSRFGSAWPEQPPVYGGQPGAFRGRLAGGGGFGGGDGWSGWRQRWLRPRRILAMIGVVIALIIVGSVGMYFYVNSKLTHSDVLVNYPGRPAVSAGQNWLITGSDSRQGLTRRRGRRYPTRKPTGLGGPDSATVLVLRTPPPPPPPAPPPHPPHLLPPASPSRT